MHARRAAFALLFCCALFCGNTSDAGDNATCVASAPDWLFPVDPAFGRAQTAQDEVALLTLPGSAVRYTQAQINNPFAAPDWRTRARGA